MAFVNRNIVAIVMIPSIIGLHYGWIKLQDDPKLVPGGNKIREQPIVTIFKRSWAYVTGSVSAAPESETKSTKVQYNK